jgi:hypothetical protein
LLGVHWVGGDGTLLARVWLDGTDYPGASGGRLALIYPDQMLTLLDVDTGNFRGGIRARS